MTDDLQQARLEAAMRACVLSPEIPTGQRAHLVHLEGVLTIREQVDLEVVVEKVLAAADAVVTEEMIAEAITGALPFRIGFTDGAVWASERITPTRGQIARVLHKADCGCSGGPDHGEPYFTQADAVLALMTELAERGEDVLPEAE